MEVPIYFVLAPYVKIYIRVEYASYTSIKYQVHGGYY